MAEMVGSSLRKGAILVAVVGMIRVLGGSGYRSATSVVVALAVAVGLYAIGIAIERRR
jgi:hypothetical protein